jgi:hypothetical protein
MIGVLYFFRRRHNTHEKNPASTVCITSSLAVCGSHTLENCTPSRRLTKPSASVSACKGNGLLSRNRY